MNSNRFAFTDIVIQKIRPPVTGQTELFDARAPGLSLRCGSSGTKVFYLTYRVRAGRKRRRGKLGVYPVMKLAEARDARIEKLAQIQKGIDPFAADCVPRQAERLLFEVCAERFITEHIERKSKNPRDAIRIIRNEFVSVWGDRDVRDITKSDVRDVLNAIVERGARVSANRALARVRKLFNWLIDVDVLEQSPCYRLPTPVAEISRDRVLSVPRLIATLAMIRAQVAPSRSRHDDPPDRRPLVRGRRPNEVCNRYRDWWSRSFFRDRCRNELRDLRNAL